MKRRALLTGVGALAGCSVLPQVPYTQRRDWPLQVRRPEGALRGRRRGVLLVRSMSAAPGLDSRGLQWLLPDGSLHVDFYEQWAVPPAQAIEDALRRWFADSGMFTAVVGPGSRMSPDYVLESELTVLLAEPAKHVSRASIALVLLDQRPNPSKVLLQSTVTAEAPLTGTDIPAFVDSMRAVVADVLREAERAVASALGR